jgi:pimeloyl-ACP methyl ester carboxylesterase
MIDYEPIDPPAALRALQELRLPLDVIRWAPEWLKTRRRRAPRPRTVLLLPGFGASHGSMVALATFLRRCGHGVHDWGLGRNTGNVAALRDAVVARATALQRRTRRRVVLVGWSLGGYIAREAAREQPEPVRRVITLGSPVIGGPRFTALAAWYRARGADMDRIERRVRERFERPLLVPVTAIYSKRDGVVAWQACIDHWSPKVRHIEVRETHFGLVLAPRVLAIIAAEVERASESRRGTP